MLRCKHLDNRIIYYDCELCSQKIEVAWYLLCSKPSSHKALLSSNQETDNFGSFVLPRQSLVR